MRKSIAAGAAILALGTAGCAANRVPNTLPTDVVAQTATTLGKSLVHYRYFPVTNVSGGGTIWVACEGDINLQQCGMDRSNHATLDRPNLFVKNGEVVELQGPLVSKYGRSYHAAVPVAWQDFVRLAPTKQQTLLGVMREVTVKYVGDGARQVVETSIGSVPVWLSR